MNITLKDRFEIGGDDLLEAARGESPQAGIDAPQGDVVKRQREIFEDIRVRVGTLLKTENVSFLLGAGASVECGGPLIGSVPIEIERKLQEHGITGTARPRIRRWLNLFYRAVRQAGAGDSSPVTRETILTRRQKLGGNGAEPLKANLEAVLATLYLWRSALPKTPEPEDRLCIVSSVPVDANADDLDESIEQVKRALACACVLPVAERESGLDTFKTLIRKLLTRPLNLKRVNIFTLNYDTLVEQAADAEGVVLLDGFVGTERRIFRPESYEQDLYFPAETTEGRVHRFDRVLHLYKLHGSITWTASEPTLANPYGVQSGAFNPEGTQPLLIYPTPVKYGETLGMPYSELFRRFADTLVRPQSVLFVVGYGFGDEHVNAIIRQALAVPSFTLVIVDPSPKSSFVMTLREQQDRRVWIAEGSAIGTLSGFVAHVLPDLRDEEIQKKVLATHRALSKISTDSGDAPDGE